MTPPQLLSLEEWDARYTAVTRSGSREPAYGGRLSRHLDSGDQRLSKLKYDNSSAALDLWNFLLTEEERLHAARREGKKIVGTMKDLGTVPVMAYALPRVIAFYPDGAWWIPCIMEWSAGLLTIADSLGINESFCPVRAMLGAFVTGAHFPAPDLLTCSVGATCDDFSSIAQRLNGMGYPILWWEIPHRRTPQPGEPAVLLPGGCSAPPDQVVFVKSQLERVRRSLEELSGESLTEEKLAAGIRMANRIRRCLDELRTLSFTADISPMPALELLIAEMLAIHFCSDRDETLRVLEGLLREVRRRVQAGTGYQDRHAIRIFWVNPVADLRVMNLLEECGGRIGGTDYMFTHALDPIPTDVPPLEALARTALADPMAGSSLQRAARILSDMRRFGSQALLISRIPGASHCALEGKIVMDIIREQTGVPVLEIEVPPVADPLAARLRTRLEALIETARQQKQQGGIT